jgi:predicted transcriptional regulator
MKRVILLEDQKQREKIARIFTVTQANVSQSLRFTRNGEQNKRIRLAAMRNGGVLLHEVDNWSVAHLE